MLLISSSLILFLGSSFVLISHAQTSNETQVSPLINVTMSTLQFNPSIKVAGNGSHGADMYIDPKTDKVYVTYINTQNDESNLFFVKSLDNSTNSFTKPIRINDKPGDVMWDGRVPPQIEVTDNGTIYTLWVSSKDAPGFMYGFRTLKIAKSIDGGETFAPAVSIVNKNDPNQAKAFQTFDISDNGTIYVGSLNSDVNILRNGTILQNDTYGSQASLIASTDGGKTFHSNVVMDKNDCECCNVNVLAASADDIYTSWRKKFPVAPNTDPQVDPVVRDIVVSHSSDGGATFSQPVKVANDSFVFGGCVHVGAPMVVDSKGNLHIVWYTGAEDHPGIYYAISKDRGKTFSTPIPVLTGDWIPPLRADLAVDNKNHVWLAWEDSYGLTALDEKWKFENTSANIFVEKISSNDGKMTEFPPVNGQENARAPTIASGNNLIGVLWNGDNSINLSILRTDNNTK
jgi:hypothetical protein